jgi:hypothetical protein
LALAADPRRGWATPTRLVAPSPRSSWRLGGCPVRLPAEPSPGCPGGRAARPAWFLAAVELAVRPSSISTSSRKGTRAPFGPAATRWMLASAPLSTERPGPSAVQPLAPPTPPTDWHSDRVSAARLLICQRRSHGQLTLGGGRSWEVLLMDDENISVDYAAMSPSPSGRVRRRCGAPRSSVLSGGQFSRVVDIDGEASCPEAGGR